jgi:hypothetical protein
MIREPVYFLGDVFKTKDIRYFTNDLTLYYNLKIE